MRESLKVALALLRVSAGLTSAFVHCEDGLTGALARLNEHIAIFRRDVVIVGLCEPTALVFLLHPLLILFLFHNSFELLLLLLLRLLLAFDERVSMHGDWEAEDGRDDGLEVDNPDEGLV